ncbi:MAG: methyltransferase domain-containing protein [Gemmatimonadales bacterium]|nr:methyltransferase domain-containing protein [Gemmatimonadales bacterium]
MGASETDFWAGFDLAGYSFTDFPPGDVVVDVGCGSGKQLAELVSKGCRAIGVESDPVKVRALRARGLVVHQAKAESLPLEEESVDGVICKVVIPYTDEQVAISECARVLRPSGRIDVVYHGAGYYLRYLFAAPSWKYRVYAVRAILNTWLYSLTGTRIPGWIGDTLYQSRRRLARYYSANSLVIDRDSSPRTYLGCPVFIYHRLRKLDSPDSASAGGEASGA